MFHAEFTVLVGIRLKIVQEADFVDSSVCFAAVQKYDENFFWNFLLQKCFFLGKTVFKIFVDDSGNTGVTIQ